MKRITPGISDFRNFVNDDNYFVDKTLLIKDFFNISSHVVLMPRPKRFGKTLNMSMIEHFFDIRRPKNKDLFTEFKIAKDTEFCEQHQNQYPVISLTLKGIKDASWEACLNKLAIKVSALYAKHGYLLKSEKLNDFDKNNFKLLMGCKAPQSLLEYSLLYLSQYLYRHFGKRVIVLADEYDAPIINSFNNTDKPIKSPDKSKPTYYQKVVSFMQTFMGEVFKDNACLKKGLLTGVLRISRESLFSEWNNVKVYSITSNYYSEKFGFTQEDTEDILKYFNLSDRLDEVKKWYNGYTFGRTEQIYNPWSIVNYIADKDDGFKPFWVNSSDNSLIQDRITEPNVKKNIEELIAGKTIVKTIKENFVFTNFESDNELIWSLLFYSGFLTKVRAVGSAMFELRIPNNEVKIVFSDIILNWIRDKYQIQESSLRLTFNSLINNDLKGFQDGLRVVMQDSISYFDKDKSENIFHVYTLGLLAILSTDYLIKSNRESGEGRYDIMLIPRYKERKSIIIEIKSTERQQDNEKDEDFAKRINEEIDRALNQIEKRKYSKELTVKNVQEEDIVKVPIVFAGKEPFVNKIRTKNGEAI